MGLTVGIALSAAILMFPYKASACQQLPVIYFRAGSAAIDNNGQAALRGFSQQALSRLEELHAIRVTGHSDRTGPKSVRLRISQARADAVRTFLIALGIPARLLVAIGAGDSQPSGDAGENIREPQDRGVELNLSHLPLAAAPAAGASAICR